MKREMKIKGEIDEKKLNINENSQKGLEPGEWRWNGRNIEKKVE